MVKSNPIGTLDRLERQARAQIMADEDQKIFEALDALGWICDICEDYSCDLCKTHQVVDG